MIPIINEEELNETQFANVINELRKKNKDKWIAWIGNVNSKKVNLKFYRTWLQIFRVNGVNYGSSTSAKSIIQFIYELRKPFEKEAAQ